MTPDQIQQALSQGHTIVAATQRLARDLRQRYLLAATSDAAAGAIVRQPPIESLRGLCQRLEQKRLSASAGLSPVEETLYYEQAIADSGHASRLLQPRVVAEQAQRASAVAAEYRIDVQHHPLAPTSPASDEQDDTQAWLQWREHALAAMAAQGLAPAHAALQRFIDDPPALDDAPAVIEAVGFDQPSPAEAAALAVLADAGVEIHHHASTDAYPPASSVTTERPSRRSDERRRAAEQAAAWLAAYRDCPQQAPSIAIVTPEPAHDAALLDEALTQALAPHTSYPGHGERPRPWRHAIGTPLANEVIIADALRWLRLSATDNPIEAVSTVLVSRALGANGRRGRQRARLDARLRNQRGTARVSLDYIARIGETLDTELARPLAARARAQQRCQGQASPAVWARRFHRWLQLVGWPNGGARASRGRQAFEAFGECLEALARLERSTPSMSHSAAVSWLDTLCRHHAFMPTVDHQCPVEVVPLAHIHGHRYDCAIAIDVHAERLPANTDPEAFIPVAAQRDSGVPHASAENRLRQAQQRATDLAHLADTLVLSCAATDEHHHPLTPTPLIGEWPAPEADTAAGADTDSAPAPLMSPLESVPAMSDDEIERIGGGHRLVGDTAAAPFFGLARHRLGIRPLGRPQTGIDATLQGQIDHAALQQLAQHVPDSATLASLDEAGVTDVADTVATIVLDNPDIAELISGAGVLYNLERDRLIARLVAWLALEKSREQPYKTIATERKTRLQIGRFTLDLRLDRVDIVDTDEGPRALLIDYKTGTLPGNGWAPEALTEAQLPLYALTEIDWGAPLGGIAIGAVDTRAPRYRGWTTFGPLTRERKGFEHIDDMAELKRRWHQAAEAILDELAGGAGGVSPAVLQRWRRSHGDLAVFIEHTGAVA